MIKGIGKSDCGYSNFGVVDNNNFGFGGRGGEPGNWKFIKYLIRLMKYRVIQLAPGH